MSFPLVVQRGPHERQLDLGRNLHCLFGLTFDAISLDDATLQLQRDAQARRPCFLSTPNVNFVIAAQADAAFRDSVLRSDLSVADGMPIVWAARCLGIPIRERVAGSTLFERLHQRGQTPMTVYFFGGPDGIAERAAAALNAQGGALRCVGFDSPGFGSVEDISSDAQIERINAAKPDFVVVALGAKKGQAWIEFNRDRLQAPVISHLGAVVNFVAGSVHRAPALWQRAGLEWLWRVKEEPQLWRRYANDGKALVRLAFTQVLPGALTIAGHRLWGRKTPARITIDRSVAPSIVRLEGDWTADALPELKRELAALLQEGRIVRFDMAGVTWLDSALLGLLLQVEAWQAVSGCVVTPREQLKPVVRRLIRSYGAELLLTR